MTEIHYKESQHRIDYYRELIDAKKALLKSIEDYNKGNIADPHNEFRLAIEKIELQNQLFYHERELAACENRKADYEKHLAALAEEAKDDSKWKAFEHQVADGLRRNLKPGDRQVFNDLKGLIDTRDEMSADERVEAFQLLKNRLANQK